MKKFTPRGKRKKGAVPPSERPGTNRDKHSSE
jgi:hypothetical protein